MERKLLMQNKGTTGWGILILLALLASGSMLAFAYAQSREGSAFNLNSPASFPVDI
jgi:drug/metabolite transporter (DMT)-like permease